MVHVTHKKLSAMPNAGMPRDVGGRSMYMASPEYMAEYARHLVHAGAKVIGGCCGTTPDLIRNIPPRRLAQGLQFQIRSCEHLQNPVVQIACNP